MGWASNGKGVKEAFDNLFGKAGEEIYLPIIYCGDIYCTGCGFVLNDMFYAKDGLCINLLKFPRYCPSCGKRNGQAISDTNNGIAYNFKSIYIKNPHPDSTL